MKCHYLKCHFAVKKEINAIPCDVVGEAGAESGASVMPCLGLAAGPFLMHSSWLAKASTNTVSWMKSPVTKGINLPLCSLLLLRDLVPPCYAHGTAMRLQEAGINQVPGYSPAGQLNNHQDPFPDGSSPKECAEQAETCLSGQGSYAIKLCSSVLYPAFQLQRTF